MILDEDQHCLEKVKERILSFLAVRELNGSMKGSILCFVGLPGVACGPAWTEAGGDVIFIEAGIMTGRAGLLLIGSLGDTTKESAQAALSYLWSNTASLDLDIVFYDRHDIHVPQGSIPKDGPSAGITILVALVSVLKNITARQTVPMTGEMTISGEALPCGGIKEKVLTALSHGAEEILIPWKNREDLSEIRQGQLAWVKIMLAKDIEDVLLYTFRR
jgi:ATP-dependent Lon protease